VLLDRSWASRLFFERIYSKKNETHSIIANTLLDTYKPNTTIILDVTLENLQKRFTQEELNTVQ
jgi:thymidylate kinase